jgi:hypothetical protein
MRKTQMKQQLFLTIIAAGVIASAQENKIREEKVMIRVAGTEDHVFAGPELSTMPSTISFFSAEFSSEGKQVKGQPYSGETSTESTQTLSDGTKITNKSKARIFRDSLGRTRREQSLQSVGPWATEGTPQNLVFINDPVTNTNYILESANKTARKITRGASFDRISGTSAGVMSMTGAAPGVPAIGFHRSAERAGKSAPNFQSESLGKQTMEGLLCDVTRTTLTIPAGEIGNDNPIHVITEKWYSPDLQLTVMSKTSDPRMGDTIYSLTGISRAEPSPSLFELPADYAVTNDGPGMMKERILHAPPPPQE